MDFQPKRTLYYQSFGFQSDLINGYYKVSYYCYSLLLGRFITILDTVFTTHPKGDVVCSIPDLLLEKYQDIWLILSLILKEKKFSPPIPPLKCLPYELFNSPEENRQIKNESWHFYRQEFLDEYNKISKPFNRFLMLETNHLDLHPYELPLDMEKCFWKIDEELDKLKRIQDKVLKTSKFDWSSESGELARNNNKITFSKRGIRFEILSILLKAKGDLVSVNKIATEIDKDPCNVRNVVNQINGRTKHLGIDFTPTGKGSYRLQVH